MGRRAPPDKHVARIDNLLKPLENSRGFYFASNAHAQPRQNGRKIIVASTLNLWRIFAKAWKLGRISWKLMENGSIMAFEQVAHPLVSYGQGVGGHFLLALSASDGSMARANSYLHARRKR